MPAKRAPRGNSPASRPHHSKGGAASSSARTPRTAGRSGKPPARSGRPSAARPVRTAPEQAATTPETNGETRLQKFLAAAGLGSRRQCEELIRTGRISIDGQPIDNPGVNVDPLTQVIEYDGERLKPERLKYFVLNKPKGVLCTNHDPAGRPRVIDLFAKEQVRLFPVGRLDEESEGLLIVTNDGDLAHQLAHPRYRIYRTYRIQVAGHPTGEKLQELKDGIYFREGKFKVISVHRLAKQGKSSFLEIVLGQGHNREVRRLFARIGHKVLSLERVAFGPIRLDKLKSGQYRELTKTELEELRTILVRNRSTPAPEMKTGRDEKRSRPERTERNSDRKPERNSERKPYRKTDENRAATTHDEPQKKRIRRPVAEGTTAVRTDRDRKSTGTGARTQRSSSTGKVPGSRTSGRPSGSTTSGTRTTGSRTPGDRTTSNRTTGSRTSSDRTTGSRTTGNRTTGSRTTSNRSTGSRTSSDRTTGNRTTGSKTTGTRTTDDRVTDSRATGYRAHSNRKPTKAAAGKPKAKTSAPPKKSNGPKTYDFG